MPATQAELQKYLCTNKAAPFPLTSEVVVVFFLALAGSRSFYQDHSFPLEDVSAAFRAPTEKNILSTSP